MITTLKDRDEFFWSQKDVELCRELIDNYSTLSDETMIAGMKWSQVKQMDIYNPDFKKYRFYVSELKDLLFYFSEILIMETKSCSERQQKPREIKVKICPLSLRLFESDKAS